MKKILNESECTCSNHWKGGTDPLCYHRLGVLYLCRENEAQINTGFSHTKTKKNFMTINNRTHKKRKHQDILGLYEEKNLAKKAKLDLKYIVRTESEVSWDHNVRVFNSKTYDNPRAISFFKEMLWAGRTAVFPRSVLNADLELSVTKQKRT